MAVLNGTAMSMANPVTSSYGNCTLVGFYLPLNASQELVRIDDANTGVILYNGKDGVELNITLRAVFKNDMTGF